MALGDQIREDLKKAMLSRDEVTVSTVRMLLAAIKNAEIAKGGLLDDADTVGIVQKEIKQRRESIEGFKAGSRQDLVEKETKEIEVLQKYLPEQLSEEEVRRLVDEAINETGASTINQMGQVMSILMPKVKGKAAGDLVSRIVKEKLSVGD